MAFDAELILLLGLARPLFMHSNRAELRVEGKHLRDTLIEAEEAPAGSLSALVVQYIYEGGVASLPRDVIRYIWTDSGVIESLNQRIDIEEFLNHFLFVS